jgi:hypothetical protein
MEMTFKVTAGRLIRRGAAAIVPTTTTAMSQMSVRLDERMMLNDPQQRPRATGVICKQDGLAGSAACGG